jgi:hypothetical protein
METLAIVALLVPLVWTAFLVLLALPVLLVLPDQRAQRGTKVVQDKTRRK